MCEIIYFFFGLCSVSFETTERSCMSFHRRVVVAQTTSFSLPNFTRQLRGDQSERRPQMTLWWAKQRFIEFSSQCLGNDGEYDRG